MTGSPHQRAETPTPVRRDRRPLSRALPILGRGRPVTSPTHGSNLLVPQPLGQDEEFEGFIALLSTAAYRSAWGMCRNYDQSQDYVQEMFARVWTQWTKTHDQAIWTTQYCLVVLRNVVIDEARRRAGKPQIDAAFELDTLPDDESHNWAMLVGDKVQHALSKLTKNQREVIELQVFQSLTPAETANLMKQDRQAIYDYRKIALKKLRGLL